MKISARQKRMCAVPDDDLFGRVLVLDTVTSTNDVLKKEALRGAEEGLVVMARTQTSGRGQWGRKWLSEAGKGVYLSLLLRPDWPPAEASRLPLLAAEAVTSFLQASGLPEATIKPPNDVLCRGRKICGTLVESRLLAGRIDFAVLGVGLNVLHEEEDFRGTPLDGFATSCRMEGCAVDTCEAAQGLLRRFARLYRNACRALS